jgi:hypothetical protein
MCTSGDLFVTSKINTISTVPYFQVLYLIISNCRG